MERSVVKIKSITNVTHDVIRIVTEKPEGLNFIPGQATEISINKSGWQDQRRPFTFTSLPENDYLEFIIKTYAGHKGVTNELLTLKKHDELVIHPVFGAIAYKEEGVFIAGGAGITPFISIFRSLESKGKIGANVLLFANKTHLDIILENDLRTWLGSAFVNILSEEKTTEYNYGVINENFLQANCPDLNHPFYVCGPPHMMDSVLKQLVHLGVDENSIVKEAL